MANAPMRLRFKVAALDWQSVAKSCTGAGLMILLTPQHCGVLSDVRTTG